MDCSYDFLPFRSVLSFKPLIDYWRSLAEGDRPFMADMARGVLEKVEAVPELHEVIEDMSIVQKHRDLIDLLMSVVLPLGIEDRNYAAAVLPFQPIGFYTTPAFQRDDLMNHLIRHFGEKGEFMVRGKAIKGYIYLLEKLYDRKVPIAYPMFFPAHDEKSGLSRYFKLDFDTRFTTLVTRGPVPELTDEEIDALLADKMNLDRWLEMLPPEHFEYQGFAILTAVEVTEGQILSALRNDLLQKDALSSAARIDVIQSRIRSLLRKSNLDLGLISIERGEFDKITSIHPLGRSILLSRGVAPHCPMWRESLYANITHHLSEPILIQDLEKYSERTGFEDYLLKQGYRGLLLAPLHSGDRLVGILELASPEPNDLDAFAAAYLKEITSLFGIAIHRGIEEQEDRIQAIIKEQYTSIHPTVEWRFREAALKYLHDEAEEKSPHAESIVFHDVYPLYGLSDIRGSSEERNTAIQNDLIAQLELAHAVLIESQLQRPLHVIDELSYRIAEHTAEIEEELRSGDEIAILHFLRDEVEPLFEELGGFGASVQEAIQRYKSSIDPDLGVLYRRRKDYEDSVRRINDTIGVYIEKQEEEAQRMYPHFFEMFKTDGVDYNLYVGASLVEKRSYDSLYLRNLRLWQLMTMCGVEWEMDRLLPELKVPLHTAHLILVQDMPLAIRFRVDEKKFDVDGAYNIRYEIVKKRIDKAVVLGTGERLTQPGKIAIVYSQPKEAEEYRRYIKYLQAAGYFTPELEELELQNLQGVYGLKALRVTLKPRPERALQGPSFDLFALSQGDGVKTDSIAVEVDSMP